jgi:serine/threonine protein kinase
MGEASTATLEEARRGTILAERYRVDRVVGAGGFGVVFAGHHLTLDVPVAIKVLHLDQVREKQRERAFARFQQEAQTLAQLRHPHIARVLDTGARPADDELPRLPWLVMEWYDGRTLTRELSSWSRPPGGGGRSQAACWRLFRPIVEAVAHAHSQGVVHRELKPDNIIIVDDSPVVLDFGIAKVMASDERTASDSVATQSDQRAFTPAYAAPEQVAGVRTGPWTDVHALGLILTELLTGTRAYSGPAGPEMMREALATQRPTPAAHNVDVGDWEPVIAKALAASSSDRFQDAGQLLRALSQTAPELDTVALEHDDTVLDAGSAPPPGMTGEPLAMPRVAKPSTPPPASRAPLALAGALLAVLLAGAWWLDGDERIEPPPSRASATSSALQPAPIAVVPTAHPFGNYSVPLIEARLVKAGWEIYDRSIDSGDGHKLSRLDIRRKGRKGSITVHEWEMSSVFLASLEQLATFDSGAIEARAPTILHVLVNDHREEAQQLLATLAASEPAELKPAPQAIDNSPWERLDVPSRARLNAIWGSDSSHIYVAGNHGTVLRFDGVRWTAEDTGTPDDLVAISARGEGEMFALSRRGGIFRRDGEGWHRDRVEDDALLITIGGSAKRVVAVGSDEVYERGSDGWTLTDDVGASLCALMSRADVIDAVSCDGPVYRSSKPGVWAKHGEWPESDGAKWPVISAGLHVRLRRDAAWVSHAEDHGWLPLAFARRAGALFLVGENGSILHVDQSLIPKPEPSGTKLHLRAIWAAPDGTLFCVGDSATVLRRPSR